MTAPENQATTTSKKLFIVLAIAFVPMLVAILYLEEDLRGKWAWDQFKRAEEAKGEKLLLNAAVPPPVPDDQNFAMTPLLRTAFDYVHTINGEKWRDTNAWRHVMSINPGLADLTKVLGDPEQGALADLNAAAKFYRGNPNYPQVAASADAAEVILTALNKFSPDIQQLREAAATRSLSRFPIEYSYEPPLAILLPHLACIKGITSVCELRAVAELEAHQTSEAFADLQLEFRLSDSIHDEPILIDHLVRLATVTIAVQGVREGMARHAWTDSQLVEFEKYLAKLNLLQEYERAMRGERALNIGSIDYLRRHHGSLADTPDDNSQPSRGAFYLAPSGWYFQNMRLIGEMYRDYILPIIDETNRVVSPDTSVQMHRNLDQRRLGPYNFYAKLLLSPLIAASIRTARAQTWVDEARIACALERYRLEHHELPDTLSALTPQYVPKISTDLFDGRLLRYKFDTNGTYVLYSIGWNQIDEDGVPGLRIGSTPRVDATKGDWLWKYPAK